MISTPILAPLPSDFLPAAYRLLMAADLPHDDLEDIEITFWGYLQEDEVLATVGLQVCEHVGLLRSLVVAEEHRNQQFGSLLIEELLRHSETLGLQAVYLLTTTAGDYFKRKGFLPIAREHVPAEIQETAEFLELCPSNAEVLYLPIPAAQD